MPQKLFIHIGAGKTGTTAIQSALARLPENSNPRYLPCGRQHQGHHGVAAAIMGERRFDWLQPYPMARLEKELAALSKDGSGAVVVSSEAFSTTGFTDADGPAALKRLFDGYDVRILYFIREQVALFESAFLQSAKTGAVEGPPESWADTFIARQIGRYSTFIDAFAAAFGEGAVDVVDYDAVKADILGALAERLGCPPIPPAPGDQNVSGSVQSAALLQTISRDTGQRLIGPIYKPFRDFIEGAYPEEGARPTVVSEALRREIADAYAEENALLAERCGIRFAPPPADRRYVAWGDLVQSSDLSKAALKVAARAFRRPN